MSFGGVARPGRDRAGRFIRMTLRYRNNAQPLLPRYGSDLRARKIGLMGGSFNPAHSGHLHVARQALALLGLDEIWWLVSPQNPLKSNDGMAPFDKRLKSAEKAAADPRIKVLDIEQKLGLRYTADTLFELRRRAPNADLVWIMGADNLLQMRHWKRWSSIFHLVPVAIFDRPAYSLRALASIAAKRYAANRLPFSAARRLAVMKPPAWVFLHSQLHPASATAIREAKLGNGSRAEASRSAAD